MNPDLQGLLTLWSERHGLATAHLRARGVSDPEGSEAAILKFADWALPASPMTISEPPATAAQVAILELAHEIGPVTARPTSKPLDDIEHELRHNVLSHMALPGFRIVTCADDAIDGQSAATYDTRDGVVVLLDTARIGRAARQEMTQALGPDGIQSGAAGALQRAIYQSSTASAPSRAAKQLGWR
ncbi:hypothetical protein CKO28_00735 [Rhodovibrio sodomensis]|uniref:Uncharacterized protein n=1 Tax=Rhodovibrio sodomensis TaxID=1088 RepID=A0ABS1D852_9PROT|nr:hypothetical protein [Rhodovibrio sodomensis]MBK1666567.1 hypothetical protein [Rhodovibrio sodomensis]